MLTAFSKRVVLMIGACAALAGAALLLVALSRGKAGRVVPPEAISAAPISPAGEALATLARRYSASLRVAAEPRRPVSLPDGAVGFHKAVELAAAQLELPIVAAPGAWEGERALTFTASAVIVGTASPALLAALAQIGGGEPEAREGGLEALALLGEARTEAVAIDRLQRDEDAIVRGAAARALRGATTPPARAALVTALADGDPWVVDQARAAIQALGGSAMERPLRGVLRHPDATVREGAADLLERTFGLELPDGFWTDPPGAASR